MTSASQSTLGDAGGLHLSVWAFRASALLLVLGVATTALGATWAPGVLRAGLFALMATPALRVMDLLSSYIRQKDWGTVAAMLAVLAVVGITLLIAFR